MNILLLIMIIINYKSNINIAKDIKFGCIVRKILIKIIIADVPIIYDLS